MSINYKFKSNNGKESMGIQSLSIHTSYLKNIWTYPAACQIIYIYGTSLYALSILLPYIINSKQDSIRKIYHATTATTDFKGNTIECTAIC